MIHLIFGASPAGSLKHAFRKHHNHRIIGFPVDLSVGPITNIHEQSGIDHYFSWLEYAFCSEWNEFAADKKVYCESLQELQDIAGKDRVTIWTSENTSEQTGLRICCWLLKDKEVELHVVNTFHAMHDYLKGTDLHQDVLHSGECNAEQLIHFYNHSTKPLPWELINEYAQDGERLLNSTGTLRSWRQQEITDAPETRDDAFILECAKRLHQEGNPGYMLAVRLVGEVIGHTEQALSDSWIEYRIRALIAAGRLAYEGDLRSMRMYKVKVL